MAQATYPYLDLTALPEIVPHVIAPHAAVLFSPDLKEVLWANGEGAKLIGTPTIGLAIEGSVVPNMSTMRQIGMATEKLENIEQASAAMRLKSGFKTKLLAFNVSKMALPDGDHGVLLVTDSLHNRGHQQQDMAQAAVDCLDGNSHASAVFDRQGKTIGESSGFAALKFDQKTLKKLADEISSEDDRLIKRVVETAEGPMACGIARVDTSPSLHLMILTEVNSSDIEKSEKKLETKQLSDDKSGQSEEAAIEPDGPRVGAFSSKRIKPGQSGPERWYYKQQAGDDGEEVAEQSSAKETTAENTVPSTETEPQKTAVSSTTRKPKVDLLKASAKTEMEAERNTPEPASETKAVPAKKSIIRKPKFKKQPTAEQTTQENPKDRPSSGGLVQTTDHTPVEASPDRDTSETTDGISGGIGAKPRSEFVGNDETAPVENNTNANDVKFTESNRPVRFVWEMDANSIFTSLSDELAEAVGDDAASLVGLSWQEVSWFHGIDQNKEIAALLEKGDTWSGKTVLWPVHGTDIRVPVDLAALPSYGRSREFEGFNGFGIIRTSDAVVDANAGGVGFNGRRERPESLKPASSKTETFASPKDDSVASPQSHNILSDDELVNLSQRSGSEKNRALSNDELNAFDKIGKKLNDGVSTPLKAAESGASAPKQEPALSPSASNKIGTPEHDVDTSILSRLPIPVLVYRNQDLLFANKDFFTLTGYENLEMLATAGGVDALFGAHIDTTIEDDARILHIDGTKLDVFPNLQRVPWDEDRAMLLTLRRHNPDGMEKNLDRDQPSDETMPTAVVPSKTPTRLRSSTVSVVNSPKVVITRSSDTPPPELKQAKVEKTEKPVTDFQSSDGAQSSPLAFLNNKDLHGLLDTATDGVVILDKNGNVQALNSSAEALFDCDSKNAQGKQFIDFLAPESQLTATEYLEDLNNTGIASLLNDGREVIGRTVSGGLIPLFMTTGRIESSDSRCAILKDITQWKKAEEELLSAKKNAEDASNQKTDFLAKVSHEVRTPLNAIIGFSDIILEERFGKLENERYHGYVRDIHRSGTHVLDLINDLLDISKIEAGEMDLEFGICDLNRIISETVALSQPQANEERIIIRTSLSKAVPNVVADQRSLRQIIMNLVTNGIKFTKPGGQVIVSTAYNENGEVVLRVRDTGIGMTHEELEKALRPFHQVGNVTGTKRNGTGLGLPLTKAMVEANRAKFHIESRANEGTLIEIFFPSQRVLADR